MALSEQEEFELLQLERERSLAHTAASTQPVPPMDKIDVDPGLRPVPLMIPEQAPAQGLAGLGDLASGQGLQQAAQVAQGAAPQSGAGKIGQEIGQFVKPSDIAAAGIVPQVKFGGIKPTGPFTAGLTNPSTALPGALQEAGQQLGKAEAAAPQLVAETSDRLRRLFSAGKPGISRLAEEGIQLSRDAGKLGSSTAEELMAYRDALIKSTSNGGRYANDFAEAAKTIEQAIITRFPNIMGAVKNYAVNALAKQGSDVAIPWLTGSINPSVGAAKLGVNVIKSALGRNLAGAGLNIAGQNAGPLTSVLLDAYNQLADRRSR